MTKTEAIGKIFPEIESLISVLHSSDWSKNPDHRKEIEKRLDDLFAENSLFYELKGMLTEVIGGLSGLVDKEGKVDKESLVLLTNTWTAFKKLKSEVGEKEEIVIPTEENLYKFLKEGDSEKKQLENELKKERWKKTKLLRELASFEAAKRDRDDQLRQVEKKEQRKRDEIKTELASIINRLASSRFPTEEILNDSWNRLKEIKNLLNGKDTGEDNELKEVVEKIFYQISSERRRRKAKQRIAGVLADKGVALEKQIEVKEQELLGKYQDYSETLDEMDNLSDIEEYEIKVSRAIDRQRKEYQTMIEAMNWGKKTISDGDVKEAVRARKYLLNYRELQLEQKEIFDDYDFFLNFKASEFHVLISELELLINTDAQILQPTK